MEAFDNKLTVLDDRSGISSECLIFEPAVDEIYIDGKLKRAEIVGDDDKSFGIFMHSLILSNSDNALNDGINEGNVYGMEIDKAISKFTASKGFNKGLIESIAPKVGDLTFEDGKILRVSSHLINGNLRFITRGVPDVLLKMCTCVLIESKFVKMTRRVLRDINENLKNMINKGLTVFALGILDISDLPEKLNYDVISKNMALVALVGVGKNNRLIR